MLRLIRLVERHPLTVVAVMVVVALAIVVVPGLGSRTHVPDQNHPEILAASAALAYVRLADSRRPDDACVALTQDLAMEYSCNTARPRVRDCGAPDAERVRVAVYEPPVARIQAGECELSLREREFGDWRVSAIADR